MWKTQKEKSSYNFTLWKLTIKVLLCPLGPEQAARLSFGLPKKKKKGLSLNLLVAYSFLPSSGLRFDST